MEERVEECWNSAKRSTYATNSAGSSGRKLPGMWGLTSTEQNDLKSVIATCEKV